MGLEAGWWDWRLASGFGDWLVAPRLSPELPSLMVFWLLVKNHLVTHQRQPGYVWKGFHGCTALQAFACHLDFGIKTLEIHSVLVLP